MSAASITVVYCWNEETYLLRQLPWCVAEVTKHVFRKFLWCFAEIKNMYAASITVVCCRNEETCLLRQLLWCVAEMEKRVCCVNYCGVFLKWRNVYAASITVSWEGIQRNCALGDKFLQFGMLLAMGIRFSKKYRKQVGVSPWWPVWATSNMAAEARDLK